MTFDSILKKGFDKLYSLLPVVLVIVDSVLLLVVKSFTMHTALKINVFSFPLWLFGWIVLLIFMRRAKAPTGVTVTIGIVSIILSMLFTCTMSLLAFVL